MKGILLLLIEALVHTQKKFSIKIQNFAWVYITAVTIFLLVHWKEVFKFKASNGTVNFSTQFCLGIISIEFGAREIYLRENVCYFSVDYNYVDKPSISEIHKYLMVNNNIKNVQAY